MFVCQRRGAVMFITVNYCKQFWNWDVARSSRCTLFI